MKIGKSIKTYEFVDFLGLFINGISSQRLRKLLDLTRQSDLDAILHHANWVRFIVDVASKSQSFLNCDIWRLFRSFDTLGSALKLDFKKISNNILFISIALCKWLAPSIKNVSKAFFSIMLLQMTLLIPLSKHGERLMKSH
jgi:hypothetical protein